MVKCEKCNGTGYINEYFHIYNGICYSCNGTGKTKNNNIVNYIDKKTKVKIENHMQYVNKLENENPEKFGFYGYKNKQVFIINIDNTYKIKSELKEAGSKYNNFLNCWYMYNENNKYNTINITNLINDNDELDNFINELERV